MSIKTTKPKKTKAPEEVAAIASWSAWIDNAVSEATAIKARADFEQLPADVKAWVHTVLSQHAK